MASHMESLLGMLKPNIELFWKVFLASIYAFPQLTTFIINIAYIILPLELFSRILLLEVAHFLSNIF